MTEIRFFHDPIFVEGFQICIIITLHILYSIVWFIFGSVCKGLGLFDVFSTFEFYSN